MNLNKLKNKKGFTLLEMIVAMSIVLIIAISFFANLNNITKSNVKNDKDIKAMDISQSEMEKIIKYIKKDEVNINGSLNLETCNIGDNINYLVNHSAKDIYKCHVELVNRKKIKQGTKNAFLYTIKIQTNLESSKFSKRKIEIITQILGQFNNLE